MKPLSPLIRASITRDANARAGTLAADKEARRQSALQDLAEAAAANDAKTARLRILRLAKEQQDRDTAAALPPAKIRARK